MENILYHPMSRNHTNPLPLLLLLLLLLAGVVLAVAVSQHAISRHGESAQAVYQACNEQGPAEYFHRGNRVFSICWVPEKERWGVVVEELINGERRPVTAILKEKLSKLGDVERWLTNTGCKPGGLP